MRSRRSPHSAVDHPVVVHAGAREHVSQDDVLRFLAKFIQEREEDADADTAGTLAQLRRVERDFKGLPPAVLDS
ncbi:LAFE_0H07734g1_1 [Lachancea fermentati]|uniref:LAFE_0H07734g1_1 n=1 Tax=Lachancea fermentati TaxID=4955 RepID=A0A1G4MK41_LACFM|nr:LAFE_0H07734g1_1 [Lachancea fermentati]